MRTVLSGKKISKLTKVLEPHLAKLKVSLPKPLFSTALNAKKKILVSTVLERVWDLNRFSK